MDGYQSFMKMHKRGNLPEVILAVNDRVALGIYRACRELGLSIPEDIGVVGFGFAETAEMFSPPLAVIGQDPREMGRTAFGRLMGEIRSVTVMPPGEIRLSEEFHANSSIKFKR
jgi:LacI family transcriptional regulator